MRLEPRTSTLPTAIDTFFRSLAEDRQEKAVAVVLSGGGSDGALGIREIKARGGLVLVQDPATAEHGDMPQSAIATEMVDFVLPPGEMPEFLLRYAKQPYVAADSAAAAPAAWTADFLQEVLTLVDQRIGHDFRSYKESTLRRRIWRRMSLRQTQQPMEYVQVLRDNPAELDALARDLVISVTYFFRDPDAWQVVAEQVLPELIAARRPDTPLRVWVPGCSTGEEAYSLAILLLEQIEAQARAPQDPGLCHRHQRTCPGKGPRRRLSRNHRRRRVARAAAAVLHQGGGELPDQQEGSGVRRLCHAQRRQRSGLLPLGPD